MENTTGQKSHSINYGPGQQRYFSLGISHSRSPGYTMCKKQKNQTKRKSRGFLSWLRKGIFFWIGEKKIKMQVKDQQQSGPSGYWDTATKASSPWPVGYMGRSPFHFYCFGRDCLTITQLSLFLKPYFYWHWCHLIAVKENIIRPDSISSTPHWPCRPPAAEPSKLAYTHPLSPHHHTSSHR